MRLLTYTIRHFTLELAVYEERLCGRGHSRLYSAKIAEFGVFLVMPFCSCNDVIMHDGYRYESAEWRRALSLFNREAITFWMSSVHRP